MAEFKKLVFFIFLGLYLILVPLLILYAFCLILPPYRRNAQTKTASLFLSSLPQKASIYLGKSRYSEETPASIKNLAPGTYQIKIIKEGYQPYIEEIRLSGSEQLSRDKVLLMPYLWERKTLSIDTFEDLIPVPLGRFLLVSSGSRLKDYFIYNLEDEVLLPLAVGIPELENAKVFKSFTMPQSQTMLFCLDTYSGKKIIQLKDISRAIDIQDLSGLLAEIPQEFVWGPDGSRYLFSFQNSQLSLLDLEQNTVHPDFRQKLRGLGLFAGKLYMVTNIKNLLRLDYSNGTEELLSDDPIFGSFIFGEEGFIRIEPFSEDIILFWGENGALTSNQLPHKFADQAVLGLAPQYPSKRLLFWTKNELRLVDFSAMKIKPIRYQRGARVILDAVEGGAANYLLFNKASALSQAFWVFSGTHILIKDQDDLFLFKASLKGSVGSHIARVKPNTSLYYHEPSGKLYFLYYASGKLSAIDIASRK